METETKIDEGKVPALYFLDKFNKAKVKGEDAKHVDCWWPTSYDDIVINCKVGYFIAPLTIYFNLDQELAKNVNNFMLTTKKCYNSAAMRTHLFQYLNYYCNYYDYEKEYLSVLTYIKLKIDRRDSYEYPVQAFFADMERYIIYSNIANKVKRMVDDNYCQALNYTNIKSPSLQYTDDHAKLLHQMSILMDLVIPLLTHYAYMHKVDSIDEYLLEFYDRILHMNGSDIYAKLYDTAYTNVMANQRNNQTIWNKQDIRSIDVTTHSTDSVANIILNIMPKYTFDKNIISFNYASIRKNTSYKITDIGFEFSYVPISSSKRDNDSISDFDKFESNLIRMNEGLYLQNKRNCDYCMKETIETRFGPFDQREIDYYTKRILINDEGNYTIDPFQKQMVFYMFYKYFNDTESIKAINREEYVKLIIAAKKILLSKHMLILPYIIAGKVEKLVTRKNINKKEKTLVEASPSYPKILEKYKNPDIIEFILSITATIISSDFSIVDMNPAIDGKKLDTVNIGVIIEEIELFVLQA